jgi:hypothetical protein
LYGGAVANPINILTKMIASHDETISPPFLVSILKVEELSEKKKE